MRRKNKWKNNQTIWRIWQHILFFGWNSGFIEKETRLVYVDLGIEEFVARYEDIPDIITDINYNKYGSTDISMYDFKSPEDGPILTTFGPYLNTCNPDVRKDIIDRLNSLLMREINEKEYKVIDEDKLEDLKNKLEQNEVER